MKIYDEILIGDILRSLRKKKGVTQAQLVSDLNISYSCYARVEQGRRPMNFGLLYQLMNYFDVDANTLLGLGGVSV